MRLAFAFAFTLLAVLLCGHAFAFGLSPFKAELAPKGPLASRVFELRNDEDYAQAIEVSVQTWSHTVSGSEVNGPADDVLTVYPKQFVLKPKASQAIRLRWTGPADVTVEQPFRLVAEQLPVALDAPSRAKKAIRFLVTYRAAVYITPEGATADVRPAGMREVHEHGKRYLAVTLRNEGTAHVLMKSPVFTFDTGGTTPVVVEGQGMAGVDDENIHAGKERELMLPWPKALAGIPETFTLKYEADF